MPKRAAKDDIPTPPLGVHVAEPTLADAIRLRDDAPDLTGAFRVALNRIAKLTRCSCSPGMHDAERYDCAVSIARAALGAA